MSGEDRATEVFVEDGKVSRPARWWTPTTHALLRHLRSNGFDAVPIPLSLAADRERLTWIDGVSGADAWTMIVPEDGLRAFGRFLRRYHRATKGFVMPPVEDGLSQIGLHDQERSSATGTTGRGTSCGVMRMRAASNPYGPGADWVRARFVEEGASKGRIYVRAVFEDNPHLDLDAYDESLSELAPDVRRQLREGDWDVRPDGGLFRREWFGQRRLEFREIPTGLEVCRFWDLAATEPLRGTDPDYTAGVLLGRDRSGVFYILDVTRTRSTPHRVERLVAEVAERDRALCFQRDLRAPLVRIEQEPGAGGKAIIDHYSRNVLARFDFRGVASSGSKETRAAPVSSRAEAGHLLLVRGPWNGDLLDELSSFPYGRHDDQVDALSGAYAILAQTSNGGRARVRRARIIT